MAVKLADTLAPMGDFEIAEAKDVSVDIKGEKKMLQKAIDDGEIGGGGGVEIDDNSTDATDKTWSVKKIFESLKAVFTNGSIRRITMEDDADIVSEGNGLHMQYSDTEMTLDGSRLILHDIAGGESRITLDDGSLLLEGSPYWNNNAKIKLSANGEDGASYVDIDANDINLKGNVKVNGQALGQATRIVTVTGAYHQNEGNYLTAQELWNGGVRDGTYLIHAHSNTSNSSCLFWGYISLGENVIDDVSFASISGTRMWVDYSTERLYYSGGDIGSICSMDFIKISNYVDN